MRMTRVRVQKCSSLESMMDTADQLVEAVTELQTLFDLFSNALQAVSASAVESQYKISKMGGDEIPPPPATPVEALLQRAMDAKEKDV